MSRLAGHELQSEGAPYDSNGKLTNILYGGTSGVGRGKCSCGALSPDLDSGNQRKAWHRDHKDQIRKEQP